MDENSVERSGDGLVIESIDRDSLQASSDEHVVLVDSAVAQLRRGKKHRDAVVLEVDEAISICGRCNQLAPLEIARVRH